MHEIFFEVFEPLPRQGPGSFACTQRALSLCSGLPPAPRILDLGCGAGCQTLHLARLTAGSILAVDSHPPLIARLRERAADAELRAQVEARVADIASLELAERVDLVWSEGALYNLGLARALPLCAGHLRPGGYLAFTDAVWRSDDPPPEARALFADYPTMGTVDSVLSKLREGGWSVAGHFDLPHAAWWEDFYGPMEQRIAELRVVYARDEAALAVLDEIACEPALHRSHGHHYGYTFFVARR